MFRFNFFKKRTLRQKLSHTQFIIFVTAAILAIIFGLIFSYLSYQFWHNERLIEDNAFQLATKQANVITKKINADFTKLTGIANVTANKLSSGELPYNKMLPDLKKELEKFPNVFGISVAFLPYKYNSGRRLYAPFLIKKNGKINLIQIEDLYDYTLRQNDPLNTANTAWFVKPITTNKPVWLNPYYGKASEKFVVDYSLPFYLSKEPQSIANQAGALTYTISLDNLNHYISSMLIGDTSYGYIVSDKGTIIAHPVRGKLGQLAPQINKTDNKRIEFTDPKTGKGFWMFLVPLNTTNWTLFVKLDKEDFLIRPKLKMNYISWMILTGVLTLLFLSVILCRAYLVTNVGLWSLSLVSSLIFIIGIALLWYFFIFFMHPITGTKIMDEPALNRYLIVNSDINQTKPATYIPTGISIQSVYFPSQNRMGISGYIWQKMPKDLAVGDKPGFVFPQQAGLTTVKKLLQKNIGNRELVLWQFDTNIRQAMNPFAYPLDKENIRIKLSPSNIAKNMVLVPDLESYSTLHSKALPGLTDDIFLEDWLITHSFFSYKKHRHNSYLGLSPIQLKSITPVLYFNISISRNVMNSIVSYIIPLFLVVSMLFAIILGGDTANIISYAGAMLIVITVAHVALRNRIAVQGISYLETFYIVVYPIIVAVTVSVLLQQANRRFALLQWRDNLITKALYWPVILGINFVIALTFFGLN